MSAVSLPEGTLFAARYRVVRCIAAGGMGAVYEVTHVETERRRALKVMHAHLLQSQELRDRFRQEARVAAQIESEFIVDVFDAGIDDATQMPFLVMELLKGEELGKLLHRRGRLSPVEVVTFLHQAALALDKTHRAQIVHRDLKPENLFLTEREDGAPRIKILDFGIAKVVADSGTNVNATRSIGTPLYMAPEQFKPGHRVSPAADLYALSMMAYTLLVGKTYWAEEAEGGNVFAFAGVAMMGPRDPATIRARHAGAVLRPAFDAWFERATAFQPEARFPSATSTVAALAEALGVSVPGISASGLQGPTSGQTQLLGSPEAVSAPAFPSGLHSSNPSPASELHASGRLSALHGSGPHGVGLHGSGSLPAVPGSGGTPSAEGLHGASHALHTSASGALAGTLSGPAARPRSALLTGAAAGLGVCLCVIGAAAFLFSSRGGSAAAGAGEAPVQTTVVAAGSAPPATPPEAAEKPAPAPGTAIPSATNEPGAPGSPAPTTTAVSQPSTGAPPSPAVSTKPEARKPTAPKPHAPKPPGAPTPAIAGSKPIAAPANTPSLSRD